ncbi:MAG: hypothetical protein RLN88_08170 [Ekhidna sp.]|uniref:hypothetical protein n=1 Tax=Ekhidna sp. TaxID=2608089 RepID=UPI0032EAEE46
MKNHQAFEITAVVMTAAGKFLFYDMLHQQLVFIILMFVFGDFIFSSESGRITGY